MPDFKHDRTVPAGTIVKVTGEQQGRSHQLLYGRVEKDMLESAVVLSAVYGFGKRKIFGAQSLGNGQWRLTAPKTGRLILDVTVTDEKTE